ncbi:adenylyl-sulfate kinase, partial [Leucobacter soli]
IAEGTADPAASARLVDELRRVAELVPGAEVRFVPRVELGAGAGAGAVDVTGLVLAGLGAQSVLDFRTPSAGGSGGAVILFTGLSGAGKSTLARALVDRIAGESSHRAVLLDGDDLRRELASELTFSAEDRHRNLERQAWVAARVAEAGGIAVCAPIAPFSASRAAMRAKVEPAAEFVVIHVSTPISVAEQRDRKGLYARARAGLIRDFTGIDSPYEAPEDADLALDTSELSVEACTEAVIGLLNEKGLLKIG